MQIRCICSSSRLDRRGVAHRHERWGGMRWTRVALSTMALASRTAKARGPDTPTLVSSLRKPAFASDGGKKARSPGRARYRPLKPLRREGRVNPVNLWRLRSCALFYFAREAMGATGTRLSLRPPCLGGRSKHQLGRVAPRGCERTSGYCAWVHSSLREMMRK
jgi:hypothetical protein